MDAVIYRKPTDNPNTGFNMSFQDVIDTIKNEKNYTAISFVCEEFPKNSFMRVGADGVFQLYHIRGDAEVIRGSKCIATMGLINSKWLMTQNLDDVFCGLDFTAGKPLELSEIRRLVATQRKEDGSNNNYRDKKSKPGRGFKRGYERRGNYR